MKHDVIVIGGGVAGLAAVRTLIQEGVTNVLLIEAGNRLGGRVHTINKNDGVLEKGAQWIHGRGDNRLWKFVVEHHLQVSSDASGDGDGVFRIRGGEEIPQHITEKTLNFLEEVHDEMNMFASTTPGCGAPKSVGQYLTYRFLAWLEEESYDKKIKRALFDWFVRWEEVDCGLDSLHHQSIRSWGEYVDYDNESEDDSEPVLSFGYSSLVDKLLHLIGDKAEILTSTRARRIDWAGPSVRVSCTSGLVLTGERVIVTLPLGVLKLGVPDQTKNKLFHPQLPSRKILAIEKLGFGSVGKIFLGFDTVFWDPIKAGIQIVHFNEDCEEDDNEENWWKHIVGFDAVIGQPNVLGGWISGKAAKIMETKTDEEILEICWKLLQSFSKEKIPRPVFCSPTRWFSDKNFCGTYSYRTPECDEVGVGPADLAEPLVDTEGRLKVLFAGEATSQSRYGTVDGAFMSGEREAHRSQPYSSMSQSAARNRSDFTKQLMES